MDDVRVEMAKRKNIIELLGNPPMRRESRDEWSMPCPHCGGDDRFHIKANRWFCRTCHPEFGDAIDFVQWRDNVDFRAAVDILCGNVKPSPKVSNVTGNMGVRKRSEQPDDWRKRSDAIVAAAEARILDAESYLETRGLTLADAAAFRLGWRDDVPLPGTWNKEKRTHSAPPRPALVIPWFRGGHVIALRYRFADSSPYVDAAGKERTAKQSAEYGSTFGGVLYGGHVLPAFCALPLDEGGRGAEQHRTLVICEGEINAISIWQVAHSWNWDVLSLGSETQDLTDGMITFARRYGRVIIWMDKEEIALRHMRILSNAVAYNSPVINDKSTDANDLLRSCELSGLLVDIRVKACRDNEEMARALHYMEASNV